MWYRVYVTFDKPIMGVKDTNIEVRADNFISASSEAGKILSKLYGSKLQDGDIKSVAFYMHRD